MLISLFDALGKQPDGTLEDALPTPREVGISPPQPANTKVIYSLSWRRVLTPLLLFHLQLELWGEHLIGDPKSDAQLPPSLSRLPVADDEETYVPVIIQDDCRHV